MLETADRLLSGHLEEAIKKLNEHSEAFEAIVNMQKPFRQFAFYAGRASGRTFSLLNYLRSLTHQPKRKMSRKQKKAYIRKNGRAAYHNWQRTTPLPQFIPWRVPIPEFKLEYIEPQMFPEPTFMLPVRNLLFLSDLCPEVYGWEAACNRIWQGYKPMIHVNHNFLP